MGNRRGSLRLTFALAIMGAASLLSVPAWAQFFGDSFPFERPWGQERPQPHSRGFSFPFFGGTHHRAAPVESSKAPPPRKQEAAPTKTVVVIGDSLADWLAYGLEEIYADTPEIGVVRKIRPTSGLVRYEPRSDTAEWSQAIKEILANDKPSAIVVMLGLNDRQSLRDRPPAHPPQDTKPAGQPASGTTPAAGETPAAAEAKHPSAGETYEFHTDKWAELYSKRIDEMIAALKTKGVPVLWVGLPAIRGQHSTSDLNYLDELYRGRAEKAGITYVDIWDGFVDENGRYTVQGPDFEGQTRRLRSGDGIHFTKIGAVKLAHYVEHELGRILSSHIAPVALPAPETPTPPKPGSARPAIGPVVPLTTSAGEGGDLVGSGSRPAALVNGDPTVGRVLVHGDAVVAPTGRADDFSWPRPATDTSATEATPAPAPPPPAPPAPARKRASTRTGGSNP